MWKKWSAVNTFRIHCISVYASTYLQRLEILWYTQYYLCLAAEIYRLVFLLSFVAKTLQLFVFNQLSSIPSQNNRLNNNQSSFKSGYSTETALLSVTKALWLVRTASIIYPHSAGSVYSTVSYQILLNMIGPSDHSIYWEKEWAQHRILRYPYW